MLYSILQSTKKSNVLSTRKKLKDEEPISRPTGPGTSGPQPRRGRVTLATAAH